MLMFEFANQEGVLPFELVGSEFSHVVVLKVIDLLEFVHDLLEVAPALSGCACAEEF
jgi:hypothetical protein